VADARVSEQHSPSGSPRPGGPAQPLDRRAQRRRAATEWGVIIVVTVVLVLLLKTFVVQAFYIPSGSMEPTLKPHDRVLVAKVGVGVHRGSIIVFKKPATDPTPGITDLIKRVIGLPGDHVSAHDGYVYIDGKRLDESWLPQIDQGVTGDLKPQTVPPGTYFVLGDNRTNSDDSRFIGDIPQRLVVGVTILRIWPLNAITLF
jgi:signal peptidase I